MAVLLPPIPYGSPPGSSFWNDWYEKLRVLINTGAVTVTWGNINFVGSNISDIVNRAHNNLQSIQGGAAGDYNHLTTAQVTKVNSLPSGGFPAGISVTITTAKLTGAGANGSMTFTNGVLTAQTAAT